jgi:hypothetical protein
MPSFLGQFGQDTSPPRARPADPVTASWLVADPDAEHATNAMTALMSTSVPHRTADRRGLAVMIVYPTARIELRS